MSRRAEAASELLLRRSVRRSLTEWSRLNGFEPAAHHKLLIDRLEAVTRGEIDRLAIFMPPGSAKSTYASALFPPWYLAQNPAKSVIAASHTAELAERWGRRVRNLVSEHAPRLGYAIAADNQSAGRWATSADGEYYAAGVGGSITGRRADLVVIDDPVRSREDAESETVREKVWDWYRADLITRLKPGASVVLVQCMAGDTLVTMADGAQKELRDIRPGDYVATFDSWRLGASRVLNWANQGADKTYSIKTSSGTIVRANERHPFLVARNGSPEWIKVRDLRIGDRVVRVIGASGEGLNAPLRAATSRRDAGDFAAATTTSICGQAGIGRRLSTQHHDTKRGSSAGTESTRKRSTGCLQSRADVAPSAASRRVKTSAPIGAESSALTIATTPASQGGCYATTATSQLDTSQTRQSLSEPQSTCDFTTEAILEIVEAGVEDVFDIQVERTENFIANGLVSHNTRWHEDDLAGRILAAEGDKRDGGAWEVIRLPALAELLDPLGRAPGDALWPEWEGVEQLERKRSIIGPRDWSALYQQRPTAEDGTYFKKEWFRRYTDAPERMTIYMSGDFAVTEGGGDFTELGVWGVDQFDNVYALDWWSGQASSDRWAAEFIRLIKRWKPVTFIGEAGPIRRAMEPLLGRMMRDERAYAVIEWLSSGNDKAANARPLQAFMANGRFHFPSTDWAERVQDQMLRFPDGKYDDAVDACSLFGRHMDKVWGAVPARAPEPDVGALMNAPLRVADMMTPTKRPSW